MINCSWFIAIVPQKLHRYGQTSQVDKNKKTPTLPQIRTKNRYFLWINLSFKNSKKIVQVDMQFQ